MSRGLAALLVLGAGAAWPCSLAGESAEARFVSPAPRTRGVPPNAEVKLLLAGPVPAEERFVLRDEATREEHELAVLELRDAFAGERADHRLVRLRPARSLPPRREFTVAWNGKEVTRFETSDLSDVTAPTAPGKLSYDFEADENSCHGDTRRFDLSFTAASDGRTPQEQLVYLVTLDGLDARVLALTPRDRWLGETRRRGNLVTRGLGRVSGSVVALDWAGNAGPPQSFALSTGLALTGPAMFWRGLPEEVRGVGGGLCGAVLLVVVGVLALAQRRGSKPKG